MHSFDDYIVYVDESGDHGLQSIDPHYPVFVLSFCLFKKEDYVETVTSDITDLKFKYFGHDQVILHERAIRKRKGPFRILNDPAVRSDFMSDLNDIVARAPVLLIASAIRKRKLKHQYTRPRNPYHLALKFGVERINHCLVDRGCTGGTLHLVFEKRGKKEDDALELEFRRVCDEDNYSGERLPFEIVFSSKKSNSSGLQLADLTARPIGRKILKPKQKNRAWDIIETKLRRGPEGETEGWGLKVFPE